MEPSVTPVMVVSSTTATAAKSAEMGKGCYLTVRRANGTTAQIVRKRLFVSLVIAASVMIVTKIDVTNAMKRSA